MSKHSISEFSKLCGIRPDDFSNYRKRGKVLEGDDKMVDDTIEPNKTFLQHRLVLLQKKSKPIENIKDTASSKPVKKIKPKDSPGTLTESMQLDLEQKRYSVQKTRLEVELKEIDKQKKMGELIPFEFIGPVISVLSHSITNEFKNFLDEHLRDLAKRHNISAAEVSETKGLIVKSLNSAVDKSVTIAEKKIKVVLMDFSQTKNVGEHG